MAGGAHVQHRGAAGLHLGSTIGNSHSSSSANKNNGSMVQSTASSPKKDKLTNVIVDRGTPKSPEPQMAVKELGGNSTGGKAVPGGRPSYKGTDLSQIRGAGSREKAKNSSDGSA